MRIHRFLVLVTLTIPTGLNAQATDPTELVRQLMREAEQNDPGVQARPPMGWDVSDPAATLEQIRANGATVARLRAVAQQLAFQGELEVARELAELAPTPGDRDAVLAVIVSQYAVRSPRAALALADSIGTPGRRIEALIGAVEFMRPGRDATTALERARQVAVATPVDSIDPDLTRRIGRLAERHPTETLAFLRALHPPDVRATLLRTLVARESSEPLAELLLVTADSIADEQNRLLSRATALLALERSAEGTATLDTLLRMAERMVVPPPELLQFLTGMARDLAYAGDIDAYRPLLRTIEETAPAQVTYQVASASMFRFVRPGSTDPADAGRFASALVALNTGWRVAEVFPADQAAEMRANLVEFIAAPLPDTARRRMEALGPQYHDRTRLAIARGLLQIDPARARAAADSIDAADVRFDWILTAAGTFAALGDIDGALALDPPSDSAAAYQYGLVGAQLARQGATDSAAVLLRRSLSRLRFPPDREDLGTNTLRNRIVDGGVQALGTEEMADWARIHPRGPARAKALAAVATAIGRTSQRSAASRSPVRTAYALPDEARRPLFDRIRDGWLALSTAERADWAPRVVPTLSLLDAERLPELLSQPAAAGVDLRMLGAVGDETIRQLLDTSTDAAVRDRLYVIRALRNGGANPIPLIAAADSIRDPALRLHVLMQGLTWAASLANRFPGSPDPRPVQVQLARDVASVLAELPEPQDTLLMVQLRDAAFTPGAARTLADAIEDDRTRAVILARGLRAERDEALEEAVSRLADAVAPGPAVALRAAVAASRDEVDGAIAALGQVAGVVADADRRATADIAESTLMVLHREGHRDVAARAAAAALPWLPPEDRTHFFLGGLYNQRAPFDTAGTRLAAEAAWAATGNVPMPLRDTLRTMLLLSRAPRTGDQTPDRVSDIEDPALRDVVRTVRIMAALVPDGRPDDALITGLETDEGRVEALAMTVVMMVQSGDTVDAARIAGTIPPGRERTAAELALARARHDAGHAQAVDDARDALAGYRVGTALRPQDVTHLQRAQLEMMTIGNAVAVLGVDPVIAWADAHETRQARLAAWTGLVAALPVSRR